MKTESKLLAVAAILAQAPLVQAYDSGSTGADGALHPTVSTTLALPANGVFNFTDVTIPAGVTLTFGKNATNTPVVILASGNISIEGTIDISGEDGTPVGTAGDGNVGDDGLPGQGGPGGYAGGMGASPAAVTNSGYGLGPGGGGGGMMSVSGVPSLVQGAGGSFATQGSAISWGGVQPQPGSTYGSTLLLPLIGGSGGGGGAGGSTFFGSGGGGGGGAILLAASGTLTVNGQILANGGDSGPLGGSNCGSHGGPGSGGGIRLLASLITGDGAIEAKGGSASGSCTASGYQIYPYYDHDHLHGGDGRIRLEADTLSRTAATVPAASADLPGVLYVTGLPTLRIASVAGSAAPAAPTGVADITLPVSTPNPVTVTFEATGIPVGNTVELTLTPSGGTTTTTISNALDGSTSLSTATASINLPTGASTLSASVTYTITIAMAEQLRQFAAGETIKGIRVVADTQGGQSYYLVTESRREIPITRAQLASAG